MSRYSANRFFRAVLHRSIGIKPLCHDFCDEGLLILFQLFDLRLLVCNKGIDLAYLRCNFINNLSLQFNGWTWNCNLNKVFSWKSPSSKVSCALPKCIEDTVRIVHLKYTQEVFWNLRVISKSKDTIIRAGYPFVSRDIDPSCQQVHMVHGKVSHIYDLIVGI